MQEVNQNDERMMSLTKAQSHGGGPEMMRQAVQELLAKQQKQHTSDSILQQLQQKLKDATQKLTGWKQVG